jgi:hypothetical protein
VAAVFDRAELLMAQSMGQHATHFGSQGSGYISPKSSGGLQVADRAEIGRERTGKLAAPNIVEPPISVLHRPVVRHRLPYCLDRIRRVVQLPIGPGEGVFERPIGGARRTD